MRYDLRVLPNGLAICKLGLINPDQPDTDIGVSALVDTGAEFSILCQSVYGQLVIDPKKVSQVGLQTTIGKEIITAYPLLVKAPWNNWSQVNITFGIRDLTERIEYRAIMGLDILKDFKFYFDGVQGLAWLDD